MPGFKSESPINLTDSHSLSVEFVFPLKTPETLGNSHSQGNDGLSAQAGSWQPLRSLPRWVSWLSWQGWVLQAQRRPLLPAENGRVLKYREHTNSFAKLIKLGALSQKSSHMMSPFPCTRQGPEPLSKTCLLVQMALGLQNLACRPSLRLPRWRDS